MSGLKTLKELRVGGWDKESEFKKQLREEAIRWINNIRLNHLNEIAGRNVKHLDDYTAMEAGGAILVLKKLFNLSDDDIRGEHGEG